MPNQLVEELGTIDYVVIEFPGSRFNGDLGSAFVDLALLQQLGWLREQGILTDAEFEAKKTQIMAQA